MSASTIGILGGMGPRATVQFEAILLDQLSGSDQEIPTIISINDGSIPDRTKFFCANGEDPVPKLQANLDDLVQLGANVICMPCNTAHAPQILGRLNIPASVDFLHMPRLAIDDLCASNVEAISILGTSGTLQTKLYQHSAQNNGIDVLDTTDLQPDIDELIRAIKTKNTRLASLLCSKLKMHLDRSGVVLLACTELSLVRGEFEPEFETIDSMEILAKEAKRCIINKTGETNGQRRVHTTRSNG